MRDAFLLTLALALAACAEPNPSRPRDAVVDESPVDAREAPANDTADDTDGNTSGDTADDTDGNTFHDAADDTDGNTSHDTANDTDGNTSGDATSDTPEDTADAIPDAGRDAPFSRVRRVRVLDFGGVPVAGAAVLRHDALAQLQQQVETDADGWARVDWRDGDVLTAPIYFQAGSILNWVSVFGFESPEHLVIGKPGHARSEVGRSVIRVANLNPGERVAVHTPCDATTLWDQRPSAEFRWYDNCVAGDVAMVFATTFHSGSPEVLLRSAVIEVTVGQDATFDAWEQPDTVAFTLPAGIDGYEEVAVEVKDRGFGVRRFLASPPQTTLQAHLAGRWQLQFWGYRGDGEVFVMKNLVPGPTFSVLAGELLPDQPATVRQEAGLVRLTYPPSGAADLRSTVLIMGDPCTGVGYQHNVISEGRLEHLVVPYLAGPGTVLAPTARSELAVRHPRLDPVLAVHVLGAPSRYPSPDLSAIHAAAGADAPEALAATYTIHGSMGCH